MPPVIKSTQTGSVNEPLAMVKVAATVSLAFEGTALLSQNTSMCWLFCLFLYPKLLIFRHPLVKMRIFLLPLAWREDID